MRERLLVRAAKVISHSFLSAAVNPQQPVARSTRFTRMNPIGYRFAILTTMGAALGMLPFEFLAFPYSLQKLCDFLISARHHGNEFPTLLMNASQGLQTAQLAIRDVDEIFFLQEFS